MMHLLDSMCPLGDPFSKSSVTLAIHTQRNLMHRRPDTEVAVSAALNFMLYHPFAMRLSAAADFQPAELQLLECNCALNDDIGHQAGVCQLGTCDRRNFMVLKPALNSSSLIGVAISSNRWIDQSHL